MDLNKIDFSKLGFDEYHLTNLRIVLQLNTPQLMAEWAETVGYEEACYGVSLVECAALAALDEEVESMSEYPDAMSLIDRVKA